MLKEFLENFLLRINRILLYLVFAIALPIGINFILKKYWPVWMADNKSIILTALIFVGFLSVHFLYDRRDLSKKENNKSED